jgi:transposase
LWQCEDEADAVAYFKQWCREAMATRLEPVKRVVRLLKSHWDNIVTYFRYHLSNAAAEGINSCIQQLIQKSCGYRNRDRFKRDVFFHLGGLDLYPVLAQ